MVTERRARVVIVFAKRVMYGLRLNILLRAETRRTAALGGLLWRV